MMTTSSTTVMGRFDAERLNSIMRNYAIYDSEILSKCGYKKDSGFLTNPSSKQLEDMKKFFEDRCPLVNFNYIISKSNNPNKLFDLNVMKYWMNHKHISVGQLNSYIEEELKIKDGVYRLLNGMLPRNEAEAQDIMNYLENLIDTSGNFNYAAVKEVVEVKADKTETKTKVEAPKSNKSEDLENHNQGYIKYPDKYRKNEIDMKLYLSLLISEGYNRQGFADMVYPGPTHLYTVNQFLNCKLASIPNEMLAGIQAAVNLDLAYLEGKTKIGQSHQRQSHFFPKNDLKKFRFQNSFLAKADTAILRAMATNAGISFKILYRAKCGEAIYFLDTTIKRMFTKEMLQVLKVKDLNEIVFSVDKTPIGNNLIARRKMRPIEKPAKEKRAHSFEELAKMKEEAKKSAEEIAEEDTEPYVVPAHPVMDDIVEEKETTVETVSEEVIPEVETETKESVKEEKEEKTMTEPTQSLQTKDDDAFKKTTELQQKRNMFPPTIFTLQDVVTFINTCDCTPDQLESLSKLCLAVAEKNRVFNSLKDQFQ